MRKTKRIIVIVLLAAAVLVSIRIAAIAVGESKKITGEEWFDMQAEYISDFETYADTVDTVISLYISGSLDAEDMLSQISMFRSELIVLEQDYARAEEEHPVKAGTHTYASKRGCEAVEEIFTLYDNLMETIENNYADRDVLLYKYLAFRDELTDSIAKYMAAAIVQEDGALNDTETEEK